ncbi:hypothetical protein DRP04_13440 [Archaeoglobales archaeon]|nr:MAG: hypothetical protein DRP04_13440 [Archaeoglobales archaeon]
MEEAVGRFLGDVIACRMIEKFGGGFEGLKKSLEYLFSWEKDFKLEIKENVIISSGLCPVKRFYPRYCEKGCVAFAEKFAERFKAKVERISTEPCTFRFTLERSKRRSCTQ